MRNNFLILYHLMVLDPDQNDLEETDSYDKF